MALRYFHETAAIDLGDTHVTIAGGVHIAAQGGIWQMAVFGFAGLSLLSDGIAFDPQLPKGWRSLDFRVQWRGRHLKIKIDQAQRRLDATLESGDQMTLVVCGKPHELHHDQALQVALAASV